MGESERQTDGPHQQGPAPTSRAWQKQRTWGTREMEGVRGGPACSLSGVPRALPHHVSATGEASWRRIPGWIHTGGPKPIFRPCVWRGKGLRSSQAPDTRPPRPLAAGPLRREVPWVCRAGGERKGLQTKPSQQEGLQPSVTLAPDLGTKPFCKNAAPSLGVSTTWAQSQVGDSVSFEPGTT